MLLCDYYSIQLKKPIRYEKKCYSNMRSKAYMSQINLQHGTTTALYTFYLYCLCGEYTSSHTHTHTHPFNGPFSGTTQVSRYQKGKTDLDFTEARDSEWQWHQLGHMQVCTLLQTDNHASTPPLCFLQAGCPSCRPTNSVKALKATYSSS